MLLIPRISEKAYGLTLKNIYIFDVPANANKIEIKKVIESENKDVKVASVRIVVAKGKVKASSRGKHARPGLAARSDFKKAYVTLSEGKIEIAAFKAEEEAPKEVKKSEPKVAKKVETSTTETKKAGSVARRRTGRRGDK